MAALTRSANAKLLTLPDCIGLQENEKCKWLNVSSCLGEGCKFYQKIDSWVLSQQRLRSLDEETQARIAQKYYNGCRPWQDSHSMPESQQAE
ncbi:MAG: hypothetical protein LBU32_10905 [Clostridiales bacterium]|jgi:hypothetical protein|nr:hypothetical protein [Clostridiales bacterium]